MRPVHHVTNKSTTVSQCLMSHFRLNEARVSELFELGAIYSDHQRVFSDRPLPKASFLKIYLSPQRFATSHVDWKRIIVANTKDFIVVDKPAGIPVHATVDNWCDNVLHGLRKLTSESLLVTQRLDVPVSGLLLFAKTPDFQKKFNRWLSEHSVVKHYRALVPDAPPIGKLVHYLEPSEKTPRRVSETMQKGWERAELTILSAKPITLPGSTESFTEIEIDLHTGRTHQIRAQLSAVRQSILGDRKYGSRVRYQKLSGRAGSIALCSTELSFPDEKQSFHRLTCLPPWHS